MTSDRSSSGGGPPPSRRRCRGQQQQQQQQQWHQPQQRRTSNRRINRRRNRQHHFFFFRHCVRSAAADGEIDLELGKHYSKNAADYVGSPLPQWGVPEKWCTEAGLGEYLYTSVLLG